MKDNILLERLLRVARTGELVGSGQQTLVLEAGGGDRSLFIEIVAGRAGRCEDRFS